MDKAQNTPSLIRVASIHVYPLKGAAGFSPNSWPVEERGPLHDRRFMLVDGTGNFLSQRTCPRLTLLRATIVSHSLHISWPTSSARMGTSTPTTFQIPLDFPRWMAESERGHWIRAQIWDDFLDALAIWPEVDESLGEFLGSNCRLVWMPDNANRLTAIDRGEPRRKFSLADSAPLLLTSEASLSELNLRLRKNGSQPIPMDRFRPNIVIHGAQLDEDDHWSAITINSAKFRATNSCKRCRVITIDQETGELGGRDPILTLATYRSAGKSVTFGQHLLVELPGVIHVGDSIIVDAIDR